VRPAQMSEAGQCIELGKTGRASTLGQLHSCRRTTFDATLTRSRSSTQAALLRVFVDSTLSSAADMMPLHARLAGGQLCDRAMASKQATPMKEHWLCQQVLVGCNIG